MPNKTLKWQPGTSMEAATSNASIIDHLESRIGAGDRNEVMEALSNWAPSALLALIVRLRPGRAQKLVEWLPDDLSLRVVSELDKNLRTVLEEPETKQRIRKLIRRADPEMALRILQTMPSTYTEALLRERPDAETLRLALAHGEDSAAAHMRRGSLVLPESWTIEEAIADIRARSEQIEKIDAIHVVDGNGVLTGFLRIRDLLFNSSQTTVGSVKRPEPVTVSSDTDQEEVLTLAQAQDVRALAVIDAEGKLVGTITRSELADIAREEAEEDMLLMGGVSPESTRFDSPAQIVRRRLPWLLAGLLGAMVAATVIGSFEHALTEAAILASFIPVVMASAGNAGMQASTVSIQALASDETWTGFVPRLGREMIGAALNGVLMGLAVALLLLLLSNVIEIDRPLSLALTVSLALLCVVLLAGTIGTIVPFALNALKLDPAVATGIFILTANDVFGVLIFFVVASQLYI